MLPGSSFITPVALAIASTPESASTMPTKPAQLRSETSVQRLKMADGFADVRQTKEPENNDDDGRWDRNQKGEPAGLFRSEQIERADDQNGRGGEFFGMRHAEILQKRKAR